MRLSDYVMLRVADAGVRHVFGVSGGGSMYLVDSAVPENGLSFIPTHHEQAAVMSAEGYARMNQIGAALVTTGPGGTNAITGVVGAWIDSIPLIIISGQVTRDALSAGTDLRQNGIQEFDITNLVQSVTKYAITVRDTASIRGVLDKAFFLATTGRPGPVWIDIPLDIQSQNVTPDELDAWAMPPAADDIHATIKPTLVDATKQCVDLLLHAKRPVMITGYGIRLAGAEHAFGQVVNTLNIPVITSWTTSDLLSSDDTLAAGHMGVFGDRAGNFTVQNADLILSVGSRLSVPMIGYKPNDFARAAKRIIVDIDASEASKPSLRGDVVIVSDAKHFLEELQLQIRELQEKPAWISWVERCASWKKKYPVNLPEYASKKDGINSFYFIDLLSGLLESNAIVCTDMGTSFTCTMQAFNVKQGQRLFTSSGLAAMGFGLPGAIGAHFAINRRVICIVGDGGLQMNLQELQTIVHYNLPILIFVLNNDGYLTIKHMQQNHFNRRIGSDPSSGLSCPDTIRIAEAYGIASVRLTNQDQLNATLPAILEENRPFLCEIMMPSDQQLIPRLSSVKTRDGALTAMPLEDLSPILERDEFHENMIIPTIPWPS